MKAAIKKYIEFHSHEPHGVGEMKLVLPHEITCVGDAVDVLYRSDKLNPSTGEDEGEIDYVHDHSSGVKVYRADRGAVGPVVRLPAWIRNAEIALLGESLGFRYTDHDGVEIDARATTAGGYPELYAIASGKALLVIQSKRTLIAVIWGGKLGVERRGIVH